MAHASLEMPYFIKASINLSESEKEEKYRIIKESLGALLDHNSSVQMKMVTINCIMKTHLPYCYWVGFYVIQNEILEVGPYQGTLGCLQIELGKGVCGSVAISGRTKIVDEVHSLAQGTEHIACDPNSQSEIVVPVYGPDQKLIAVFDVDSSLTHSFSEVDKNNLEEIMTTYFS